MVVRRPRIALTLLVAAVVMMPVTVVSAADAGYRIEDGAVITAFRGAIPGSSRGFGCVSALLVVVVALLCLGDVVSAAFDGGSTESTTAASERYAVVRYREPTLFASDRDTLYLRTRSWLLSYEGDTEFACFMDESSGAGPEWLFDHVNATDVDTLHVVAKDGTAWDIRFDPRTLRPLNPLDRCTEAPDPGAD